MWIKWEKQGRTFGWTVFADFFVHFVQCVCLNPRAARREELDFCAAV